jgi:hypothetical protein
VQLRVQEGTPPPTRPTPAPTPRLPTFGDTITLDGWVISLARMETRPRLVIAKNQAVVPQGHFYLLWVDARNTRAAAGTLQSSFTWQLQDTQYGVSDELSPDNTAQVTPFLARESRMPLWTTVQPGALTHPLLIFDIPAETRPAELVIRSPGGGPPARFALGQP